MRSFRILIVLLAVGIVLWKCTTTPTKAPSLPPSWAESEFVRAHITTAMLNSSPGALCPHYSAVDHLKAWDLIIRAIVEKESNYQPREQFREPNGGIDKVTGRPVMSEGYLQLSYQDTLHSIYRSLPAVQAISWEKKNLTDPQINLAAGLAIMDARIQRSGPDVVTALAPYWSTVREYQTKLLPNLKKWIPECFQ